MEQKHKRPCIRFLLLLLSAVMIFASCGKSDTQNSDSTTEETDAAPVELTLIGGDDIYKIVRSAWGSDVEVSAARKLNSAIKDAFGSTWQGEIAEDWDIGVQKDDIIDNDAPEILVGLTNRRESHEVYDTLGEDEYTICAVGKKLVIVGSNDYSTSQAVDVFIEQYIAPAAYGKKLSVMSSLSVKGEASLRKVQINSEATYRIMSWNLGCAVGNSADALEILIKYLPDIISMQECNKEIYLNVINNLPDYYKVAVKFHSNGATYVYTPIIYNSELFTIKDAGVEWLRGRYTGTNTKSLSWAVLEDKTGGVFAVIDFHGAVCTNTYKGFENYTSAQLAEQAGIWKTDNVKQTLEVRDRICAAYGNIPLIINGDCNFNDTSTQYRQMTDGGMYDAEFSSRLRSVTGYKTSFSYGTQITSGHSIDHIFGTNGIDFVEHNIALESKVTSASDHCPVYVDFNLQKPE
mgnify:FL=1